MEAAPIVSSLHIVIRPEVPADYAAIGEVHARAFHQRSAEAAVVALVRQHRDYDPDLSLVAEQDGQVVGHALFSPATIRLMDENVRAVKLGPIGVLPEVQGRGIGGVLVDRGHEVAREKGYDVTFLIGHSTYYPRFGYRMRAYGGAEAPVDRATLPGAGGLTARSPLPEDIPALRALREHDEGPVDFSIDPGPDLLDWISPHPDIASTVYLDGERVIGYARVHRGHPDRPRIFLAADSDAALAVAAHLAEDLAGGLVLPVHPRSRSAAAFPGAAVTPWNAAMARSLRGHPVEEYFDAVERGDRVTGRVTWPVSFDLT